MKSQTKHTGKRRRPQSPSSSLKEESSTVKEKEKEEEDDDDDNEKSPPRSRRSLRPRRGAAVNKSMKDPSDDEGFLESESSDGDDDDGDRHSGDDDDGDDKDCIEKDDNLRHPSVTLQSLPTKPARIEKKMNKTSPANKKKRTLSNEDSDSSSDQDNFDNPEDEETSDYDDKPFSRRAPAKRRRASTSKAKKASTAKKKPYRGSDADRTCPHCGKICSSKEGLKYHVTKMVCRKPESARGAKSAKSKTKKNFPRIRGPKGQRTCPDCGRVFTSLLGCNYHMKHRVCMKENARRDGTTLLHTLEAGQRFITKFGVVEVVRDDQETPTAVSKKNFKQAQRDYQRKVDRHEQSNSKLYASRTVYSCVRRHLMSEAYMKGEPLPSKRMLRRAVEPPEMRNHAVPPITQKDDPSAPPASFPDRIVVCKMVTDKRERYEGENQDDDKSNESSRQGQIRPVGLSHTLYLQRRLLLVPYDENDMMYCCQKCGRHFESVVGYRYHSRGELWVCENKHKKLLDQAQVARDKLSERVLRLIHKIEKVTNSRRGTVGSNKRPLPTDSTFSTKSKRRRFKVGGGHSVYPSIWLGLGFIMPPKIKKRFYKEEDESSEEEEAIKIIDPKETLKELRAELDKQEDKLERDNHIAEEHRKGAMYAGVYHSLGFSIPFKLRRLEQRQAAMAAAEAAKRLQKDDESSSSYEESSEDDEDDDKAAPLEVTKPAPPTKSPKAQATKEGQLEQDLSIKRRRKRGKKEETPKPPTPPQPVINSQVLVAEIDKGRYPSRKRYNGKHKDICEGCKIGVGDLTECGFCPNVVHMQCMMERVPIQNPESNPDFMCYVCIRYVLAMRRRAERRRIKKLVGKKKGAETETVVDGGKPDAIKKVDEVCATTATAPAPTAPPKEPTYESEFHKLAAVGHELHELLQLLGDAREGLTFATETSRLNDIRRSMMVDDN